ncbi:MAG: polyprenyl synthetase family protein [Hadesarchaea archaeon]|nr:polyprenyl synthetase family protein [Hadesarchaea archaeon]
MDLIEYLNRRSRVVDEKIDELIPEEFEPSSLAKATRHLIQAGGKRLRPVISMVSCEAVGGKEEDVVESAAALELLHTFTLVHDDIMDRDEVRRGVKTVHQTWNEPIAIIAGDALFAKVFEAIAENAGNQKVSTRRIVDLVETVSKASFEICQGQALDMEFEERKNVSESEYMNMIERKTGVLFEASTKVGALLGGGNREEINSLADYGRLVGIAFQIHDDILGVSGEQEKVGKPVGSDIQEGKCTLIVTHALSTLPSEEKNHLLNALGNKEANQEEIEKAIEVIKDSGSIEFASNKAKELVEEAKSQIDSLPDSEAKKFLIELANFSIEREL